jgi:hypothetical protein
MMPEHSSTRLLLALAAAVTIVVGTTSIASAQGFSQAQIFFELNDTDGDLGIHASIDGRPWTELRIDGAGGRMLEVFSRGRLRSQSLTQLSFESAEPSPMTFFRRFTEGRYQISARAPNGTMYTGTAVVSHVMAAAPENIRFNRVRAAGSCDDPPPTVTGPVTVEWNPVTRSHRRVGRTGAVTISRYQVFVDRVGGISKIAVDLPRTQTSFRVPTELTDSGGMFKVEIIARTSTGNNTAIETCFRVP